MMSTVQITSSKWFYAQISVHTETQNTYASLAQEFQKHLSNESMTHVIFDHVKYIKSSSKQRWKNREHCVQYNKYVNHQDVKMYCSTTQFPELNFIVPHILCTCVR